MVMPEEFDPKKFSISMVSCTIDNFPKAAVDSMILVCTSGILRSYLTVESTLLPQARNITVGAIYNNNPNFTHIVFVDSDMTNYSADHIIKLIMDDKPIISALVVSRKPPYKLVIHSFKTDNELAEAIQNKQIVESKNVGMAFTVIKREVLDAMKEDTEVGPVWFTVDREERESFSQEVDQFKLEIKNKEFEINNIIDKAIAMGQHSHRGTELIGEDIEFCRRARKLGFRSWVDCGVQVGHLAQQPIFFDAAYQEKPKIEKPKLTLVGVD